ncbi:MAG: hypothetical protein OER82_11080 [Nitrosopumilus sp.]|nr:hypothetical protein [Nitrosopumilus sp.]
MAKVIKRKKVSRIPLKSKTSKKKLKNTKDIIVNRKSKTSSKKLNTRTYKTKERAAAAKKGWVTRRKNEKAVVRKLKR